MCSECVSCKKHIIHLNFRRFDALIAQTRIKCVLSENVATLFNPMHFRWELFTTLTLNVIDIRANFALTYPEIFYQIFQLLVKSTTLILPYTNFNLNCILLFFSSINLHFGMSKKFLFLASHHSLQQQKNFIRTRLNVNSPLLTCFLLQPISRCTVMFQLTGSFIELCITDFYYC